MAASEYSVVAGIPVAYLGLALSVVVTALAAAWWLRRERWALLAAYGLLLLGTLVVAWLTYLELAVIKAVCPWCVAFAASVVAALVLAGLALARTSGGGPHPD